MSNDHWTNPRDAEIARLEATVAELEAEIEEACKDHCTTCADTSGNYRFHRTQDGWAHFFKDTAEDWWPCGAVTDSRAPLSTPIERIEMSETMQIDEAVRVLNDRAWQDGRYAFNPAIADEVAVRGTFGTGMNLRYRYLAKADVIAIASHLLDAEKLREVEAELATVREPLIKLFPDDDALTIGAYLPKLFEKLYAEREKTGRLEAENAALRQSLWSCPNCAFTFDAGHDNTDGSGCSCPVCAEAKLTAEIDRLRAAVQPWVNEARQLVKYEWSGNCFVGGVRLSETQWRELAAFGEDEKVENGE